MSKILLLKTYIGMVATYLTGRSLLSRISSTKKPEIKQESIESINSLNAGLFCMFFCDACRLKKNFFKKGV